MVTQLIFCLFGHQYETESFSIDQKPFEKGTTIKVVRCKKCPYTKVWAYPVKGNPYPVETNWAKKNLLGEDV